GTCSAGPRPSRATHAASLRPGGTIGTRRRRSISKGPTCRDARLISPMATPRDQWQPETRVRTHWPPRGRGAERSLLGGLSTLMACGLTHACSWLRRNKNPDHAGIFCPHFDLYTVRLDGR